MGGCGNCKTRWEGEQGDSHEKIEMNGFSSSGHTMVPVHSLLLVQGFFLVMGMTFVQWACHQGSRSFPAFLGVKKKLEGRLLSCCPVEYGQKCLAGLCCSWHLPSLEGLIFKNGIFFLEIIKQLAALLKVTSSSFASCFSSLQMQSYWMNASSVLFEGRKKPRTKIHLDLFMNFCCCL